MCPSYASLKPARTRQIVGISLIIHGGSDLHTAMADKGIVNAVITVA
jgi:hypothetical protein